MSSNFAASFAPYQPPPDEAARSQAAPRMAQASIVRPWFPSQPSSSSGASLSYQSGGLPSLGSSAGGDAAYSSTSPPYPSHSASGAGMGTAEEGTGPQAMWDTRFGMRVDLMAAFAYVLGPISALLLLILETHNDYVRFHAYQSALFTTPLVVLRIFFSLVHFPGFFRTLLTLTIIVSQAYMAFRAYIDAAQNGLSRYRLPYVGLLAEQWVGEE